VEIGIGQAAAVATAAAAHPEWGDVTFRSDLQGIARIAVLSRTSANSR
jgi:tRNA G46 methylase TrmB